MPMQELITAISNTTDPVVLNHAVDKFYTYFHYIQNRCGINVNDSDARTDALLRLLPDDAATLQLIADRLEPISAFNIPCTSLVRIAEGKIEMLKPGYREPGDDVVNITEIVAKLIAAHKITYESVLTKELKAELALEIEKECIERTKDNCKFDTLSKNKKEDLLKNIMIRIKTEHDTLRTVHHYFNPSEKNLFTLHQLTNSLAHHLYGELDTIIRTLPGMNLKKVDDACKKNKTSFADELKKLKLSKSAQSKINVIITKLNAIDDLKKAFKKNDPSDVVNDYQQLFNQTKPLLMKNADPITKRLLHWIGLKLNIKRFQNEAVNRYTTLEKYVAKSFLLHANAPTKAARTDEPPQPKKNKR